MMFFKVYVAALYLDDETGTERILDDDVPRRLEIGYRNAFSAEDLAKATREGIENNEGVEAAAALEDEIEQLNALYRPVEAGDRYAISFVPGVGTQLAKNGELLGVVRGAAFARALFAIWFGPEPFDSRLKRALLRGR